MINSNKVYLIPLGVQCIAAQITKEIVNQPRFVFDWNQINVESMRDVIHLKDNEISSFWQSYFDNIDENKRHTTTGSWFPHDTFESDEEKNVTTEKYIRRTKRLHKVFDLSGHVVYVIAFGLPKQENIEKLLELTFAIQNRQVGSCSFIICNAMKDEIEKEPICFLYQELPETNTQEDWNQLPKLIAERMKQYFISQNIEVIPFKEDF